MIVKPKYIMLKNGKQAVLRAPKEDESKELLLLMKDCAVETSFLLRTVDEIDTGAIEDERTWIKGKNESARDCVICAYVDGELAGDCGISPINDLQKLRHRASLGIGLRQAFWELGLGTALISYAEQTARALGFEQLELDVFATNMRARRLYEKLGFTETGRIPHGQKLSDGSYDDLIYMVKAL